MIDENKVMDDLVTLWILVGEHRHRERDALAGAGRGLDPTRGRGRVLALLQLKDGISTKDLAQIVGIRVSSLNELLAKMEHEGLVTRQPSPADGRVMLVHLTDAGRNAQVPPTSELDLLDGFNDDEMATLDGYLLRMIENAQAGFDPAQLDAMRKAWEQRREMMESMGAGGPGRFTHMFGIPHGGRPTPFFAEHRSPGAPHNDKDVFPNF